MAILHSSLLPKMLRCLVGSAIVGFFIIAYFLSKNGGEVENYTVETTLNKVEIAPNELKDYRVKTHLGSVTLEELNEKVYKPFGYEILHPTLPVPTLRMLNEPTCQKVFSSWLKVSKEPQPKLPPKKIPDSKANEFLLNGYAAIGDYYFNDKSSTNRSKPRYWDLIPEMMNYSKTELGAIGYYSESVSLYHAMDHHRLDGSSGLVVGSMKPWVEVMALRHGAKKILTVEYNTLTIPTEFQDRLSSILPMDFVNDWEKYAGTFDFAASFSSLEHSGLGRYGDPLDPIGDLREMLKIKCMLNKGGILFLGLPLGIDAIQYNAHRIYGSVRLALMFYGFEWLGTYSGGQEEAFDFDLQQLDKKLFELTQHTLVLKKL
ncbi:DUF268 domain-containing protein [Caenorhabditis elegans]|uniref:DUF268 domain-containing protein n=1 Tax=Caenorhabditis elegans TaxID=6239 RepID=O45580_CAEEL|nr:DUF268 domain-containing protein [Caenorhabditis elegans]CAB04491.2 DUF268 domain-containing protein [Caenorhabditis elegans]|eukprot:NP_493103.1 Uncharacterized protein CELE_F56H6.2 [Caenorhabditis elegans]